MRLRPTPFAQLKNTACSYFLRLGYKRGEKFVSKQKVGVEWGSAAHVLLVTYSLK